MFKHNPKAGLRIVATPEIEPTEFGEFMVTDQHVSFMPLSHNCGNEECDAINDQLQTEYHTDDLCVRLNEAQYFNRSDERNHHARVAH